MRKQIIGWFVDILLSVQLVFLGQMDSELGIPSLVQ